MTTLLPNLTIAVFEVQVAGGENFEDDDIRVFGTKTELGEG